MSETNRTSRPRSTVATCVPEKHPGLQGKTSMGWNRLVGDGTSGTETMHVEMTFNLQLN